MKPVHQLASVLKVMGMVLALIGLFPAVPGVVQADVEPAPAGILSVGFNHTCALKPSGAVDCWGWDYYGQVTGAPDPNYPTHRFATHPGPYIQVSAGDYHTCALMVSGAVDCWGWNHYGQSTPPAGTFTQVSAGMFHTCALTELGALDCWGDNSNYQAEDKPGPYLQVSAGSYRTCAVTQAGAVDCWGWGDHGELADQAGPYTQVSAGWLHTCALQPSGAVDCWGWDEQGQVTGARDPNNPDPRNLFATHPGPYVQVSAGREHTCAVQPDGAVDCWGSMYVGESADQAGPYIQVGAGQFHSCALKPDGAVDCWGDNSRGQAEDQPGPYGPYNPNLNAAPVADPGGPYLGAIDTAIAFDGSGSSDPDGDPLTYAWTFGDGGTGTGATPAHSYAAAAVYDMCLTVNDGTVDSETACTLAVVYDPSGGFVTGGGWIDSPAGAYKPDLNLSGRATFGLVSKYKKGAQVPTGTTQFQFDVAGLSFYSETYEWLVVNQGGTNAQFKGSGLINGAADPNGQAYKFMLWAGDDSPDTFHIRIWWEDDAGEHDVYDNGTDQAIGAGNIVVHTGK